MHNAVAIRHPKRLYLKVLIDNFKVFLQWQWTFVVNTKIRTGAHFKSSGQSRNKLPHHVTHMCKTITLDTISFYNQMHANLHELYWAFFTTQCICNS